ncbi:MAG: hypothetical protein B7X59_12255 [Polaromonas sp. 39-63-203]|jgi:hypothetical protein|nr:MAG: hypothetical protein B7Y54_12635 [Polaromonas sp. 35-63-240]OYZ76763.1 MAG: hypothetical protein B7Y03_13830 [Polaromonas sp. 24-62-144]OZA95199.1 MAG: hypothetical protein B7X59_12255 [Polaromonas sp. 39-63-203]
MGRSGRFQFALSVACPESVEESKGPWGVLGGSFDRLSPNGEKLSHVRPERATLRQAQPEQNGFDVVVEIF